MWQDETNFLRFQRLSGSRAAGKLNTGNTAFVLFEPFAKGLSADSFPSEESVYFGSRVGARYPYCVSRWNDPPPDSRAYRKSKATRIRQIKRRRLEDLGEEQVDPALIERIIWEGDHGSHAAGFAQIMRELAAKYPLKEGAQEGLPVLPLMPNLTQAINMGATDARAVLAIVPPPEGEDTLSVHLARLLFEPGIAGRVHAVRLNMTEWQEAISQGQVTGGQPSPGLFFLAPETFGRTAEVQAQIPPTASETRIRGELLAALTEFHDTWNGLDRDAHMQQGAAQKIGWREWNPFSREFTNLEALKSSDSRPPATKGDADPDGVAAKAASGGSGLR